MVGQCGQDQVYLFSRWKLLTLDKSGHHGRVSFEHGGQLLLLYACESKFDAEHVPEVNVLGIHDGIVFWFAHSNETIRSKIEALLNFENSKRFSASEAGQILAMQVKNQWIGIERGWELLGKRPTDALVSISGSQLATHAHVIGATGSGKTNLIHHLIAQDIENGQAFVVLDLRGDLVNAAVELCESQIDPSKVKIIDLRERNRPFGFNPLSGAGEPYFRALASLAAIESQAGSWGVQLEETLRNALMLLGRCGQPLTRLEQLLSDHSFRKACLAQAQQDYGLQMFWSEFEGLSKEKQRSLSMPVMNKISLLLATDTLRRILSHPDPIDLESHLNTPGSVLLVSLAVDQLHGAGRMMGNMILASICREIFARVDMPESRRNPVRIYVDEFENFNMDSFDSLLTEGRRFKCSLVLGHQTFAQLTPKMRSLVLNNVGVKVAFRTGRDDSHAISRDLFGDPSAYDFTGLAPGESILWRKGQETIELEVNQPLFKSAGARSRQGAAYLRQVYQYAGESQIESMALPTLAGESTPITEGSDVQDWIESAVAAENMVANAIIAKKPVGNRIIAKSDLEDLL